MTPEDERGQLPDVADCDDPDAWRDVCDDPTDDPYGEDDDVEP